MGIVADGKRDQPPLMPAVLSARAASDGERVAVELEERSLGYAELERSADALGRGLRARGVEPGTLVVLVLPNRAETAIAVFALARLGAVAVPGNVFLKKDGLAYVFEQSGARIAIVDATLAERVADALAGRIDLQLVVVAGSAGRSLPARHVTFEEVLAGPHGELPALPLPGDPWAILYTSGTTGPSKGVVLPQQMWATEAHDAAASQHMTPRSVSYTFLPLFHLNALVFGLGAAITLGARAVVRSRFPQASLLDDLRATGATHSMLPPFLIASMLAAPPSPADADFPLEVVGTMSMPAEPWRAFESRFGARITVGYGLTESGSLCIPGFGAKPGSSGRPNPRYDFRVVDEHDRPLPPGAVGEVVARPRHPNEMMLGYHRMPEATVAAFRNLWFHTGDAGSLDEEGFFHFADRKKDMIKRRGENVSSFEVEEALARFPGVGSAAVVPFRDALDEEVRAFVVPEPGASVDPRGLIEFAGARLAYFMVPRYLDVVAELPRNAVGKVEKFKLRSEPLRETTFDAKAAGVAVER
jgi:crotonobetaine/carnitine-CoA ligase